MVVGTEDSEELEEMLFRVPSKTVDLSDGDRVKLIGPFINLQEGLSFHLYQNNNGIRHRIIKTQLGRHISCNSIDQNRLRRF